MLFVILIMKDMLPNIARTALHILHTNPEVWNPPNSSRSKKEFKHCFPQLKDIYICEQFKKKKVICVD